MKEDKQKQPNQVAGHGQHANCRGIRHMLLMLLCCLAPLGLFLLLKQSGYDGAAGYLVLLLCPLMHLGMLWGRGKKSSETLTENKH
jgi:membrane-bound metal-dependent hydrolase YbcI (DUF457 family)